MKFGQTLTNSVIRCIKSNNIPMLIGEPGIGKSSFMEALAKNELGTKCFTLACNQLADKADLTGARLVPYQKQVKQKDGTVAEETHYYQVFYPHKTITDAVNYAIDNPRETPILFLDELNRTTPDVTSELLSIPTARKLGETELPANLKIVAAGNDKGNVTSLDKASISRFVFISTIPDAQTFISLHSDLNIYIKNVLMKNPNFIFGTNTQIVGLVQNGKDEDEDDTAVAMEEILDDSDDMSQITTPRTIAGLSRFLNDCDKQEILNMIQETNKNSDNQDVSVLQEMIEGFVGKTLFTNALLTEIVNGVMTLTPNTPSNNKPPKPAVYDTLKSQTDLTSITSFITSMTENEKSQSIVYALWEQADNSVLIKALAENTPVLENDSIRQLGVLATSGMLDSENCQALLNVNVAWVQGISLLLNM